MRTNPFCVTDASSWLVPDRIPQMLDGILREAERRPQIYDILPWLRRMDVLILCLERSDVFSDADLPSSQEAIFTTFFAAVTRPLAEMVEALYTTPLLRSMTTVGEILRRMALAAGVAPLSQAVVTGVCASFIRQRIDQFQGSTQPQMVTWKLSWHQSTVRVRRVTEMAKPIVILVSDEASGKVLAFRCTDDTPSATDLSLTLYDALVYPNMDRTPYLWQLRPPDHLHVQGSLPSEIVHIAKGWKMTNGWEMEIEERAHEEYPFLRQWECEIADRLLDPVQYLRLLDRACERAFGYAPFLAKQQVARRTGWCVPPRSEPTWNFPWLRELLPNYQATVGADGTLEWRGWHYRDAEEDVLQYWAHDVVTIRPSPATEATIWVYWKETILCYATADELRHEDGSYRPYWFPYSRLGE
jgi:hypothetical protein